MTGQTALGIEGQIRIGWDVKGVKGGVDNNTVGGKGRIEYSTNGRNCREEAMITEESERLEKPSSVQESMYDGCGK